MSEISRVALFGKLNSLGYRAIESATVFCKMRGNPYVELIHWLHQLLQQQDSDLHRIIKHFNLDVSRLAKDVVDALDRLPRGASSISDLSSHVEDAVERGWVFGTLMFGDSQVRTGHLVVGMMKTSTLRNALLAGGAGVGKTAVVEGFALRIAAGDVPPSLREVSLRTLDVGLLQAGASMKGEFENRLRQVIDEVQASPKPVILFIDEAHTLIGAGGAAGTGDAANLLKPALARGTLRTVAATTWAEYKKYFEKDPALTRRFHAIQVDEPSEHNAILMMRGMASTMEKYHRIQLMDEPLEASVRLSHRYIPARQLPDKAVSLIDTACARVAVSQHATPARLEDTQRQIDMHATEVAILDRQAALGRADHERREN